MDYKKEISNILFNLDIGISLEEIYQSIEIPPNKKMGDFSFPTFRLAKILRKSPVSIAEDLKQKIKSDLFEKIEVAGSYLNFYLDKARLCEVVLRRVFNEKERYGSSNIGEGKNIVIDYSSTNIAKPFHIGHIRSTVIGDSLKRIFRYLGYNVVAINYLGDYGTQFGVLLSAYTKWGDKGQINSDPINELLKLYVKYTKEAESDPTLMDEARHWFKKLEQGDEFALNTWKWFKEISLKEFNRVYEMLDISFDSYNGEFYHSQFVEDVVKEMREKKLLEISDEATVINLDDDNPPAIILKKDGSSTYISRDIATALHRKKVYNFDKNIYVVAIQQNLHFKTLKELIYKMDYEWSEDIEHVQFGMVSLKDGTLSTRKGKVVFLEDVLNKAVEKTSEIIEQRNPNLKNKNEVAKQIGIGAVKFQELFNNRIKDYVFDWDTVLNFEGETGPYVQYAHARANQILERLDINLDDNNLDFSILNSDQEIELVKAIYNVPSVIINAMEKREPSLITRHVTDLAQKFNSFYNNIHILNSKEDEKQVRALLVYSAKVSISNLLGLLGIYAPNKM